MVWPVQVELNFVRGWWATRLPHRNRRGYIPIVAAAITRRSPGVYQDKPG